MGIGLNAVHLLTTTLPALGDRSDKKMLTLGVQDCYFTYEEIVRLLTRHRVPFDPIPLGERQLTAGFQWVSAGERHRFRDCIHQTTLFRLLGFRAENIYAMDVSDYEGADVVHDLNVPVDPSLHAAFDFVFDAGTLEHVFSTKDALFNICRMCRVGGVVVNVNPVDFINHGFINLNAELFRDCFAANGFDELALKYVAAPKHPRKARQYYLEYDPGEYHCSLSSYYHTSIFSAYRKVEDKPLTVPTQGGYRNLFAGAANVTAKRGLLRTILSSTVVSSLDAHFASALLFRSYLTKRKGRRVAL